MRAWVLAVLSVLVLLGACGGAGRPPVSTPPPAPPETFQEFAVGLFGGVGGSQQVLRVQPDGVAVLSSSRPASGRLSAADLDRLRGLLTSERFRREVAVAASTAPGSAQCTDLFTREVTMGSLTLRKTDRCGDEPRPDTPAFDEILATVHDELEDRFAAVVGSSAPPAVPLRLDYTPRSGTGGFSLVADTAGRLIKTTPGSPEIETRRLTGADRDALRLLTAILTTAPPVSCSDYPGYRLTLRSSPPRSATSCGFRSRAPEFWAVVALLANQFD